MVSKIAYEDLIRRSKETALLQSCASLLGWEEQTYMPPGGVGHRGNQMALLARMAHERRTDPAIGDLLGQVENTELTRDPVSVEAVNIRELRRVYNLAVKLPKELVEELARTTTLAHHEWVEARKRSDFEKFRPWLEKIVALKQREAQCLGFEKSIYDPLLDQYEPGAKTHEVTKVFAELRSDLVSLVSDIMGSTRRPKQDLLSRDYPIDRQRIFGEAAAAAVGFDFHRGRLDTTAHPFCSGIGPGDTRLTTRYKATDFSDAFFSTLHEAGHGMYDQGLDAAHYGTPMGEAVSLGIHESQSRLWENAVGRNKSFWIHFFPWARQLFRESLHDVALDDFHFAVNGVQPSFIRVDADEATYNLHILIRFELEQALLTGDLPIEDLPGVWNEKYHGYLGITPKNHAEGCLQDVHWSGGLMGYFPTYTLGNLYAAQLYDTVEAELGGLNAMFARGEFAPLLEWLREKIHRPGQRFHSRDLIERVTGKPPSHKPLIASLRRKFAELYGI